ncbi:MAG: 5'-deoxyadenosine deaminase [Planctomycetes bacterium]|nr:5'-deoxyadenosine deaminase [Planctomycetota bacterium]
MIFQGATILSMGPGAEPLQGDLRVVDGRIAEIAPAILHAGSAEERIDARGCIIMPGLVQAHVHLCQTLFRNMADDMELLDWLRRRIWPFEAWHDAESMAVSARLGLWELIAGGTTAILDMGSVRHTDELFAAAEDSGIRYVGGKCLMDHDDGQVPAGLLEDAAAGLAESRRLIERWQGAADGRIGYALAPRFAVSCSDACLEGVAALARERGVGIHTHASENLGEIAEVKRRSGRDNVRHLDACGLLGPRSVLAHCIHLQDGEAELLRDRGAHVAHCPSSNMKLASGFARVPELLELGVNVALGADGAPCNNRLDAFREMQLAGLIHKPRYGPRALPARRVLEMATLGGARALGLDREIGSLEPGKSADLIVLAPTAPDQVVAGSPEAAVVFSLGREAVRDVMVAGRFLKRDFQLLTIAADRVVAGARKAWARLARAFPDLAEESRDA